MRFSYFVVKIYSNIIKIRSKIFVLRKLVTFYPLCNIYARFFFFFFYALKDYFAWITVKEKSCSF